MDGYVDEVPTDAAASVRVGSMTKDAVGGSLYSPELFLNVQMDQLVWMFAVVAHDRGRPVPASASALGAPYAG
jgi:hypothetical protein